MKIFSKTKTSNIFLLGLFLQGVTTLGYGQDVVLDSLQPTSFVTVPKANLLLTLDDSGSMLGDVTSGLVSGTFTDSYNPKVLYQVPPNLDGTPRTDLNMIGATQGFIDPFWADVGGGSLTGALTRNAGRAIASRPNVENIFTSTVDFANGIPDGYWPYNVIIRCPPTSTLTTYASDVVTANGSGANIDPSLETLTGQQDNCRVWWTYYKTRNLALKSALTIALLEQDLTKVRVSWQFLGNNGNRPVLPLQDLSTGTNFANMMRNIYSQRYYDGTPLTGAAYRGYDALTQSTPAINDPYRDLSDDGTPSASNELKSCRQSYHVLMTDGEWNTKASCGSSGSPSCLSIQNYSRNHSITLPTPDPSITPLDIPLAPSALYSIANSESHLYRTDTSSNTASLADLALYYWINDIRPTTDMPNDLPQYNAKPTNEIFGGQTLTPFWNFKNDPAVWQHIVTYGITFGLQADKAPITYPGGQEAYDNFILNRRVNGTTVWTGYNPIATNDGGDANDVKHAAFNGRGQYFNANTADGLVDAFDKIFSNIIGRQAISRATGSTVAQSSVGDESLNQLYVSEFDPGTFDGKLKALRLYDGDEANYVSCFGSSTDKHAKGELCEPTQENWEASAILGLNPISSRNILTRDLTVLPPLYSTVAFDNSLPAVNKTEISSMLLTPEIDKIIDYIRGDHSNEIANPPGTFRNRSSRLGDIGRSNIVYSKEAYLPAGHMDINNTDFQSHYSLMNINYSDGVIFVGANDGMLHAFNARTGEEVFAYIPSVLLSKLPDLTKSPYVHTAFVDGKITVKDVDLNGSTYSRVLVSALGAGGKGLFALDVTDPTDPILLWEIDENTAGLENVIGKISGQVVITQLQSTGLSDDGRWVAITGNGYQSGVENTDADDVASLLIIDLKSGDLLSRIDVADVVVGAVGPYTNANGLGEVVTIDEWYSYGGDNRYGADYRSDMAYAGDLQGNVWKFDLRKIAISSFPLNKIPATPGKTRVFDTSSSDYVEHLFKAQGREVGSAPTSLAAFNQPITAGVEVVKHPTGLGNIVFVGTGALFSTEDISTKVLNGFYAVWDNEYYDVLGDGVLTRNQLRPVEINTITHAGSKYYQLAPGQPETIWANEIFTGLTSVSDPYAPVMGWFIDFNQLGSNDESYRAWQRPYLTKSPSGEDLVGILPTLLSPPTCSGADNKTGLLLFDTRDGSQSLNVANFDLNDDDEINSDDLTVSLPSGVLPQQLMGQQLGGLIYSPSISSGVESLSGSKNKTDCNNWQTVLTDGTGGIDASSICVAKYIESWLEIVK